MKNIFKPVWAMLLAVAVVLVSCGPTAYIERNPSLSLNDYQSFGWAEVSDKDHKPGFAEEMVRDAVERELSAAGYNLAKKNPDVVLSYDVLTERTMQEHSNPVYSQPFMRTFYNPYSGRFFRVYYPTRFMGYDNYTTQGNEGTVTVTMTDAKTGKTILQGWASNNINSRNMTAAEANKIVSAIFKKMNNQLAKK